MTRRRKILSAIRLSLGNNSKAISAAATAAFSFYSGDGARAKSTTARGGCQLVEALFHRGDAHTSSSPSCRRGRCSLVCACRARATTRPSSRCCAPARTGSSVRARRLIRPAPRAEKARRYTSCMSGGYRLATTRRGPIPSSTLSREYIIISLFSGV